MNRWEQAFQNHVVFETLNQLESYADRDSIEITAEASVECRRFVKVLEAFRGHLEKVDPELLPASSLDNLNSHLRHANIWNQMIAYGNSGSASNVAAANNHLSTILGQLSTLIGLSKSSRVQKPLVAVERAVDRYMSELEKVAVGLRANAKEVSTSLQSTQAELSQLREKVEVQKEETNSLISKWQEQFSNAQDKRSQEFAALREKLADESRSAIDELTGEADEKLTKHFSEFTTDVTSKIDDATEKHHRILELYHLVAGDSVASSYIDNADKEKAQADGWRRISLSFIVSAVAWLGLAYYLNIDAQIGSAVHWPKLITTISLTGALFFGAAYAAQQSTRHRNNEKATRKFALEVKAIDPFIASMDLEDRSELKKKLSERLFGQSSELRGNDGKVIDEHVLGTLLRGISDVIAKAKK